MVTEIPVPSWKRTRPSASSRVPLSREVIVDTAIRLLDRDGLDGVSMRRVAEELKTGAASLYAHVANKDELLELVHDRIIQDVEVPDPDPARWEEQVRAVGRRMYEIYQAHRDVAVVSLGTIPTTPKALEIADRLLAILIAGGVPGKVAGWALDRLALYIAADAYEGSILFNQQRASGLPFEEFVEEHFGKVRDFYTNLPPERFPTLTRHLGDLMGGDGRERFDFGLDMIIRSLGTYVTKPA